MVLMKRLRLAVFVVGPRSGNMGGYWELECV